MENKVYTISLSNNETDSSDFAQEFINDAQSTTPVAPTTLFATPQSFIPGELLGDAPVPPSDDDVAKEPVASDVAKEPIASDDDVPTPNFNAKCLVINGSPHKDGNTARMVSNYIFENNVKLMTAVYPYFANIKPCIDCRYCYTHRCCSILDDMHYVYDDDYAHVIIASPVYFSSITPPLFNVLTRLQLYYANKRFFDGEKLEIKPKTATIILTGGGDGKPDEALRLCKIMARLMNATVVEIIQKLDTDTDPVI
ncbi:MAG: flavodoxin family protein [Clostridiales bacterium]|jgi:multimeric flavodoxin WrbA|nr:flavodoxin family protein [Clostridiales bacterium]